VNNLAVVDYSKNSKATVTPIQRCPTGAIVWIDEKKGPVKGLEAKKITRQTPLPLVGQVVNLRPVENRPVSRSL
jgi:hypothetical protein